MAASMSGIAALLFLVLVGPTFWVVHMCWKRYKGTKSVSSQMSIAGSGESVPMLAREEVPTMDYMLALLGYAIGIGNVWRFPYVISQNGGAAAVVAYISSAILVAIPLFFMEFVVGQHTRLSTIEAYHKIRPRWTSLGVAQALVATIVVSYFQVLLVYCCVYIGNALIYPLPWTSEGTETGDGDKAAEDFWFKNVLNKLNPNDIDNSGFGACQPQLLGYLAFMWIFSFLCLAFGKKVLAKVTWVTVLAPFILMIILLVRTLFLEGAWEGIKFYVGKFEVHQLTKLEVWATACGQIIFSLSPGMGTAITMSSYTRPKEDVFRVCLIVAVSNSVFSIVGGFAMFSIIGELARVTGRTVADVASRSGTGLAFISIAQAMPYFGALQNVMAVFFFTMLLTLGIDSSFAWTESVVSYVEDFFLQRSIHVTRWKLVGGVSIVLFLLGIPYCTRLGSQLLDIVDHNVGAIILLIGCAAEGIMLNLDFGWPRIIEVVRSATVGNPSTPDGRKIWPLCWWKFAFHFTIPTIPAALGSYIIVKDFTEGYGDYPVYLLAIGWVILAVLGITMLSTLWRRQPGTLPKMRAIAEEVEMRVSRAARTADEETMNNVR